jgi:hypothetical protein
MTLTNTILSAVVESIQDNGIFSDTLEAGIMAVEGQEIQFTQELPVEGADYPTSISYAVDAIKGDLLEVGYWTNAGTPSQRWHVAGKTYVRGMV